MAVQVTTTTLFNNPTTSPINSQVHSHSSIPIGAIIGGAVAGSALAVLATVSWIYWGRQIQKTKRKQEERDKTRYNTLQNAQISGPKVHYYRPPLRSPPRDDKRVKFAGDEKDPTIQSHVEGRDTTPLRPAWLPAFSIHPTGSWPLPLKKLSQNSIQSTDGDDNNNDDQDPTSSRSVINAASWELGKPIPRKASNASTQSNASKDSHLRRVPSSLILAALGGDASNRNSLRAEDRQSDVSFWGHLFRAVPGSSHADPEGDFPVGTAV